MHWTLPAAAYQWCIASVDFRLLTVHERACNAVKAGTRCITAGYCKLGFVSAWPADVMMDGIVFDGVAATCCAILYI